MKGTAPMARYGLPSIVVVALIIVLIIVFA